jgi:hypothetical protein
MARKRASTFSVGTRLEETSDVTQCDFDLREIGLEHGRKLMQGLDQNFVVRRQSALVFHAPG